MPRPVSALLALAIAFLPAAAFPQSAELSRIGPSEHAKIDRFDVCRIVWNDGDQNIMVPHNSAGEWSAGGASFIRNIAGIPGVRTTMCGEPMRISAFNCSFGIYGAGDTAHCDKPTRQAIPGYAPTVTSASPTYSMCDDKRCRTYGTAYPSCIDDQEYPLVTASGTARGGYIMGSSSRTVSMNLRIPDGQPICAVKYTFSDRCESGHDATSCPTPMLYFIFERDMM